MPRFQLSHIRGIFTDRVMRQLRETIGATLFLKTGRKLCVTNTGGITEPFFDLRQHPVPMAEISCPPVFRCSWWCKGDDIFGGAPAPRRQTPRNLRSGLDGDAPE